MQMSKLEIVGKFNRSDDKKGYLKILAQLNGCSEDDIKKILADNGVDVDAALGVKPKKKRKPATDAKTEVVAEDDEPNKKQEWQEPQLEMKPYKSAAELMEAPELTADEQKRLERALAIPMPVRQACVERMEVLTSKIMELEKEHDEICDFLNGEVSHG